MHYFVLISVSIKVYLLFNCPTLYADTIYHHHYYSYTGDWQGRFIYSYMINYFVSVFIAPKDVVNVEVELTGAMGGNDYSDYCPTVKKPCVMNGGFGGKAKSFISVIPGQSYFIFVGGKGISGGLESNSGHNKNKGGYNGGGNSGLFLGGGGGGASDIRTTLDSLISRIIVGANNKIE